MRLSEYAQQTAAGGAPDPRRAPLGSAAPRPHDALFDRVHDALLERLGPQLAQGTSTEELRPLVDRELAELLAREDLPLRPEEHEQLQAQLREHVLGLGPLEPLLADPEVTEVMVVGCEPIWVERGGELHQTRSGFSSEAHLRQVIDRIVSGVGRRVDEASPMVDARLADGSRVNAVVPPLALNGSSLTIRKFGSHARTLEDLVTARSLTAPVASFLQSCVRGRLNVLVTGGTGSGKTTMLNALSAAIGDGERIVTIEDAAELDLHHRHLVRLESRPANAEGRGEVTIRDLVRNSLRMRPDRIIVGEVRSGEALDMLQAMNTGHDGSLSTLHANSPRDALSRLETMVLMAGLDLPLRAVREQAASAVDLIVHVARLRGGGRAVTSVTEVVGMEGEVVTLSELFAWGPQGLVPTGLRPGFTDRLEAAGETVGAESFWSPGSRAAR